MSTLIRTELSKKNQYYISKYRYLELKYFCLQYNEIKKEIESITYISSQKFPEVKIRNRSTDFVENTAMHLSYLTEKLKLIEQTAIETDPELYSYILLAVTCGFTFNHMQLNKNIPCGRSKFYQLYRKFFYLLSQKKHSC